MNIKKLSTRELCGISLFASVTAVCAQISLPLPGGVPFTLQTWAICLAGVVLGAKNGTLSAAIYVLLGAVGVPVFANFTGGVGIISGPTGGFILSFPILALLAGMGGSKKNVIWLVAGLVAGTIVNWLAGMVYFSFVLSLSLQAAFAAAVLPFIPSAVIRIVFVTVLGKSIKTALAKSGMENQIYR
jgi:biotin transport system substrate-specific component